MAAQGNAVTEHGDPGASTRALAFGVSSTFDGDALSFWPLRLSLLATSQNIEIENRNRNMELRTQEEEANLKRESTAKNSRRASKRWIDRPSEWPSGGK